MKDVLESKRENIKLRKQEFEMAISNNESGDVIHAKSVELDNAITELLKESLQHEEENKKLLGKYQNILEKNYRNEIVSMIKKDVSGKVKEITDQELEQLCNNIYVDATLRVYNIDEQEIIRQIMYRNNLFVSDMEEKGIELDSNLSDLDLKFLRKLKKKYVKIIKERIGQ